RYQEQRYQLTAVAPGKASIGPASVRYKTGSSPLSALDRLFGGSSVSAEQTVWSAPITLSVQELPAGQPASFYGAVGTGYTLRAEASPQQVQAGEAVNLTVTVKGPGNLKSTQNLQFPTLPGFKNYPAAPESGKIPGHNRLGYKTFKTVLVPEASGQYTIPALTWSYFNPENKSYKTLQTNPIELTVTPAAQAETGFNFNKNDSMGSGFQTLTNDIAYLKTSYSPAPTPLVRLSLLTWLNGAFLSLVILGMLFAAIGKKSLEQKKSFLMAKAKLRKASSCQATADALSVYLQHKFKIATGSLPLKNILMQLTRAGVTPATAQAFSLLWQQLEAERFAPTGANPSDSVHLSSQALDVLKLIEEETK
ncbi:MAG: BatD family protein, partial [Elusimicrobiaceae bacterium]|nr:BatD family protein [Elusimicrobiaceae bacterium]